MNLSLRQKEHGEKKEQDQMRNNPTTHMNISEAQRGNDLGIPFCFQTSETSDFVND